MSRYVKIYPNTLRYIEEWERPMVYIERNFSILIKLVTFGSCHVALVQPGRFSRYDVYGFESPCTASFKKASQVSPATSRFRPNVMGFNPGACQKPNHRSQQALLGPDSISSVRIPETQDQNPTGLTRLYSAQTRCHRFE